MSGAVSFAHRPGLCRPENQDRHHGLLQRFLQAVASNARRGTPVRHEVWRV